MDAASFERVYDSFQKFHAFLCVASFGRKQWRSTAGTIFRPCWCSPGTTQRRESLGVGGHPCPGDAALSHRGPLVR